MFINWLNDVVAERAYSRKLEQEADSVGLDIMARAGYDPRAMLDLWELMAAVEADAEAMGYTRSMESRFPLLRTHPTSEARQEAIASHLPKAMQLWQERRAPKRATIEKILAEKATKKMDEIEIPAVLVPTNENSKTAMAGAVVVKVETVARAPVVAVEAEPEVQDIEYEPEREV